MEQFVYPTLTAFFAALITFLFAKRKNTADAKSAEIDAEIKSADFYRSLLDDATKRLNQCLEIIDHQNIKIIERDKIIESQDIENRKLQKHISQLMDSNETLITEIKKFKQLNGKVD